MKSFLLTIIIVLMIISISVMFAACKPDEGPNLETKTTEENVDNNNNNENNDNNTDEENVDDNNQNENEVIGFEFSLINDESTEYDVKLASGNTDTAIIIPSKYNGKAVTKIRAMGFYNNSNIESVVIPNSITNIDFEAFKNCPNLKSIEIPSSVVFIGEEAFNQCSSLASVTFNEGLEQIGGHAFRYTALTNVELPSTIKSIGAKCFQLATLSNVNILATTPPEQRGYAFHNHLDKVSATISVPTQSVDEYKAHGDWSDYVDKIQAITD